MPAVLFVAFRGRSFTSKVIQFVTRSMGYSHVGFFGPIDHPDEKLEYLNEANIPSSLVGPFKLIECWPNKENRFQSWCVSDMSNHSPGTPFEIWELPCTEKQKKYIEWFFYRISLDRVKYDWLGCLGFVFRMVKHGQKRLFCSEGCITPVAVQFGWRTVVPAHVSPQSFVELIEAAGAKMIHSWVWNG